MYSPEWRSFNDNFKSPRPKKETIKTTTESQRRLRIRREIEWRQECKVMELDIHDPKK
ncbi:MULTISPECIES: hypothetical protein [Shewanella]|jgi:hypothetical protein|uniref:hypothetical protein n=1 Tax=Shewanella TaxID=22 RepID=UPI000211300E|nr:MULTISPECIES: hypothetical protein [Shewanella]AEH16365.1 hypothetical protein Sbal117_4731 [Shewanella baltica OS117]NRD34640.1 hypothetical protein [Shewanella sp. DC2-4]GCF90552.1 hypothetical protein SMBr_27960 [Shewanella sp. M-Br]